MSKKKRLPIFEYKPAPTEFKTAYFKDAKERWMKDGTPTGAFHLFKVTASSFLRGNAEPDLE